MFVTSFLAVLHIKPLQKRSILKGKILLPRGQISSFKTELFQGRAGGGGGANESQKGLPLETKNTQNHENPILT